MENEKILEKWYEAKKKIEDLEDRINEYKNKITKEMNTKNIDKIQTENFCVSRKRNTRSYLTKDNVPVDIWNKYSTRSSFDAFYLTKH
jgi:hypothetical protein